MLLLSTAHETLPLGGKKPKEKIRSKNLPFFRGRSLTLRFAPWSRSRSRVRGDRGAYYRLHPPHPRARVTVTPPGGRLTMRPLGRGAFQFSGRSRALSPALSRLAPPGGARGTRGKRAPIAPSDYCVATTCTVQQLRKLMLTARTAVNQRPMILHCENLADGLLRWSRGPTGTYKT